MATKIVKPIHGYLLETVHLGIVKSIGSVTLSNHKFTVLQSVDTTKIYQDLPWRLVNPDMDISIHSWERVGIAELGSSLEKELNRRLDNASTDPQELENFLDRLLECMGTNEDLEKIIIGLWKMSGHRIRFTKVVDLMYDLIFPWNKSSSVDDASVGPNPMDSKSILEGSTTASAPVTELKASEIVSQKEERVVKTMAAKKDLIVSSVKKGASVGLADEAGNVILEFVNATTHGQLEPYMKTAEGTAVVKLVAATLLMHGIDFVSDDKDVQSKVSAGCGLVIEAASRDVLQPRMAELRKVGMNLARIGERTLPPDF